jgi:hypothetical protein
MLTDISQLCEGTNNVTPSETFIPLPVVWMETFQARQTLFSCHKAEYTLRKLPVQSCYCSARVLSDISRRSYTANVVWRVFTGVERSCGPQLRRYINLVRSTAVFCHVRWRKKDNRRGKRDIWYVEIKCWIEQRRAERKEENSFKLNKWKEGRE